MLGLVKDHLGSLLTELPMEKGKQKAAERIDQEKLRRRVGEQMKNIKMIFSNAWEMGKLSILKTPISI